MTARSWLRAEARRGRRAALAASACVAAGAAAGVLAAGLLGDRAGLFTGVPELLLAVWAGAVAAALAVGWRRLPAVRASSPVGVGAVVEREAGLRSGALAGLAGDAHGSPALAAHADRRMQGWLAQHGASASQALRYRRRRDAAAQAVMGCAGFVLLALASVLHRETDLWRPITAIRSLRAPVEVTVDHREVARGDSVRVTVTAAGRDAAVLHRRLAGREWEADPIALDGGRAVVTLGPLDADLLLVAESGRRRSDTVRVVLRPSLFLAELAVTARYPAYIERPDEPLASGDTVRLPIGTVVFTRARASLALTRAAWMQDGVAFPLDVDGGRLSGARSVRRSGTWRLALETAGDIPLDGPAPTLTIEAVPDRAPAVTLIVPSADTVMPTTLVQPLVIEIADDHRVTAVEVVSRRVSRLGTVAAPTTEPLLLPPDGLEQGMLTAQLDVNARGFLPGDTAYVKVRARDNAPNPRWGETIEIRLRLPALSELREAVRDETRALAAAADSLAARQQDVTRAVEDLARERRRDADGAAERGRNRLEFEQAERAGALGEEQKDVFERAEELRDRLSALDRSAWEAGLTDPALHQQLADLRELLDRALSPELEAALRNLETAMEQLDPEAMRQALDQLAQAQEALRRELERSRELFERAALEGDLTSLAADAAQLAQEQAEWNRAAAEQVDSTAAAAERRLAEASDSLAARLEAVQRELAEAGADSIPGGAERAEAAAAQMRQAARAADDGARPQAQRAGERASEQLDPVAQQLQQQRDELRESWRQEVTAALDAALLETAQLARDQEAVTRRMERGETGADVRAAQGAVRDGLDRVMARVQDAAGKNALIGPTLGTSLGYARNRMGTAIEELAQGAPNPRGAAASAGEALDGLNALAMQLLRSRGDVAGAESGSGLSEAVERMAQLAEEQGQMAGQAGGMLPLMQGAGQAIMQELQALARQQRALAAELERMRAQGDQPGAGELAEEADEIARALDAGVLTRDVVERQEQLYRRLLDAGRTLRGPETDERQERQSTAARPGNVRLPVGARPPAAGPRYPYPGWEALQHLSPAERRAVLEYFRRLNDGRP